jgi:hypothetical protein
MPPTADRGCLVIADISGYTDYVVTSPLEYAEDVVADVTATVVERLEPILRVNKLEGDAAFGYALEKELDASMLLDTIEECYFGFRRRLRGPEEAAFAVEVMLAVPPAVAWEYLTSPQRRLLWQVDEIDQADEGGRRCTGTSSVCVDGRARIYEEILDWRPFDYFTERNTLPGGIRVVQTTSLEAVGGLTRVITRGRPDGGRRLGRLAAGSRVRRRLQARYERLAKLMPAEIPEERRLPLAPV